MSNLFTPTWHLESIFRVQPGDLIKHQIEAVIVDLDNTLIPWNEPHATEEMTEWINQLRANGIGIYLLSNNNQSRVAKVAEPLGINYTARALKPISRHFNRAIQVLNVDRQAVVVIGDQLMTDILGANRLGLKSILVKPLVPNDNVFTWANRLMEKAVYRSAGLDPHADWGNTLDD